MSWDEDLARADLAAAAYFDTVECTAVAMTKPPRAVNAEAGPDESRPGFTFMASIESAPEFSSLAGANRPTPADRSVRQVNRICLTALASGWPWMLRQGDRVKAGTALYQVAADPDDDGTARVAVWLNRLSA